MELYRALNVVGQEREFVMGLTNREREEYCSSMSLSYSFLSSFSSFVFLLTHEETEENPAITAAAPAAVSVVVENDETCAYDRREKRKS